MAELLINPVIIPTKSNLKTYNFYIVHDGEHLFLVDAGINSDESWQAFNDNLNENGYSIKDIDYIMLTHNHIDHVGLVNRILAHVDIPVYAHPVAIPLLQRDEELLLKRLQFFERIHEELDCGDLGKKRNEQMRAAIEKNRKNKIDATFIPIEDGDIIGKLHVINAQGHSRDHLAFHEREQGVLFSGDHLFAHMNSNALLERDDDDTLYPSLQVYEDSLQSLLSLHLKKIFPGHGRVIEDPKALIERRLDAIDIKSMRILQVLSQHSRMTASELASKYYGSLYDKLFQFIISDVVGHLSRLERLGKVESVLYNDVRYYFKT